MAERAGFSEYVVARRPLMYRTAWVLCGDHHQAEDLVQHVLTKLYVAWPRVARMDSVDGYVRTMLVNANLDRVRRRRESAGLEGFDQPTREVDHDSELDLRAALTELAPGATARGRVAAPVGTLRRGDRCRARHRAGHRQEPDRGRRTPAP
jgi:DNA-directed RNA polymerase specialized sigma24 family protein